MRALWPGLGALAALAATGCAMAGPSLAPAAPSSAPIVYTCPDGATVSARYPDSKTAIIEYQGRAHTLKTAASADGARYIGDGLQWWTKGMTMGMISPLAPGKTYAEPGPQCTAPGG
jgi:membrane-bound inhibitor of C-type lysozyme